MKRAIFPGSFDPVTLGHLDIIERSSRMFDEVIVVILENSEKRCLFTREERLQFLEHNTSHLPNVRCMYDCGLTVEVAQREGASAIVRGVRSMKDFEYERDIASVNHHLDPMIETCLLFSSPDYSYVSSSIIKELFRYHKDISAFVSEDVVRAMEAKREP